MANTRIEDLMSQNAALAAEVERLKAEHAAQVKTGIKVSTKGAISVYGINRFPVTFYAQQWDKLASLMPQIQQFAKDHAAELTTKE